MWNSGSGGGVGCGTLGGGGGVGCGTLGGGGGLGCGTLGGGGGLKSLLDIIGGHVPSVSGWSC